MAPTKSDDPNRNGPNPAMTVVDKPIRRAKIHVQGNARTIIVPRCLGVGAGESICLWRGRVNGECVYLKAVRQERAGMIDTRNDPPVSEELCGLLKVRDFGDDTGLTVMAECDQSRYGDGTRPLLMAGRTERHNECLYLLVIPESVVENPTLLAQVVN